MAIQNTLNKVFKALGKLFDVPSASAYCQARQKLKPEIFVHLNALVRDDFYRLYAEDGDVKLWRGHRVLGVDGTYLNLPDTPETRKHFTVQGNGGHGIDRVQALASVLFDVLNDIGLDAAFGRKQAEKNFLFNNHLAVVKAGDVLVFDRNYADYTVMAKVQQKGGEFVIRFPNQGFTEVRNFWVSQANEAIVTLKVPNNAKKFVEQEKLPQQLQVRLIKVVLDTGELEVLGTSLLDPVAYPASEFKQLYGWRWHSETYYGRIKNIFELERFSSSTISAIEQDFFGVIFLATLEGVLIKSDQTQLAAESQARECQNLPKVNRAVSYCALLDRTVVLLCDPHTNTENILQELHHLFRTNPTRHRPNRRFDRPKHSHARQLWFAHYVKRLIS